MKRYIDELELHDPELVYAITEALEKDGDYSVECYDRDRFSRPMKNGNDVPSIILKIFRNEKVISTNIGFTPIPDPEKENTSNDSN
jgi:hypothetical protein